MQVSGGGNRTWPARASAVPQTICRERHSSAPADEKDKLLLVVEVPVAVAVVVVLARIV